MIAVRLLPAAAVLLAGSPPAYATTQANSSGGHFLLLVGGIAALFVGLGLWRAVGRHGVKGLLESALRLIVAVPGTWAAVSGSHRLSGVPPTSLIIPLWLGLAVVVLNVGGALVPGPVRTFWASLFTPRERDTHGTAASGPHGTPLATWLWPPLPMPSCWASCVMRAAIGASVRTGTC